MTEQHTRLRDALGERANYAQMGYFAQCMPERIKFLHFQKTSTLQELPSGVVYLLQCTDYHFVYISETGCNLCYMS